MRAQIPTGVCDPIPTYRQGLILALSGAGFPAEEVGDLQVWASEGGRRFVLLTASLPEDSPTIRQLTAANRELAVVVLLRDASLSGYRDALSAGAAGVVAWDENPEAVIQVLRAVEAIGDYCLLPAWVARAMAAAHEKADVEVPDITDREKKWLQMLANGATVAELAAEASYSEREMFRLLHVLYQTLGVKTRVAALVTAARIGLLD